MLCVNVRLQVYVIIFATRTTSISGVVACVRMFLCVAMSVLYSLVPDNLLG